MRIDAIHLDHWLSYETFTWEELDPHLNVIVGPNGVGKTNLFYAVEAVRDALGSVRSHVADQWADAGYRGADADMMTIALDLQFNAEWEQRLLCSFLANVLCDQQEMQQIVTTATHHNLDSDRLRRFAAWVQEQLHPDAISWFFRGRLVATHVGRWGWQCRYEALPGKPAFRVDLTGSGALLGQAEHNHLAATQNSGPLFVAWRTSLTEQQREQLDNGLTGATPEIGFPMPDLSRLPKWVSSQQGVPLQIGDQMQIVEPTTLATRRAFASMAQLSLEPGKPLRIRSVFWRILERALVFTDNVRLVPQRMFIARDLFTQPLDLSSGEQLARFLFCKQTGSSLDRQQYDAVQKLFSHMTGRQFYVVLRPVDSVRSSTLLPGGKQQALSSSEQQPDILLEVVTSGVWGDIPLEFSGAGIAEALFLSAILAGSKDQVVLLDEPALNLSPTMQTTLLDELLGPSSLSEGESSQFLLNTHAPSLVPSDAIDRVSRFTLRDGHTVRQALTVRQHEKKEQVKAEQRSRDDLGKLRQLLRGNLAARTLLFNRAVLLVEGETELGALPVWCPDLVLQDIGVYAVGGKGEFVSPLRLLQLFAIPWAILGDGEVLWDLKEQKQSGNPLNHIRDILAVCCQPLPSIPGDPGKNARDYAQWQHSLEACGVFTLARGAREGFEKTLQTEISVDVWAEAETKFGKNKVARGRYIAEECSCPKLVTELIQRVLCHLHRQDASILLPEGGCL